MPQTSNQIFQLLKWIKKKFWVICNSIKPKIKIIWARNWDVNSIKEGRDHQSEDDKQRIIEKEWKVKWII